MSDYNNYNDFSNSEYPRTDLSEYNYSSEELLNDFSANFNLLEQIESLLTRSYLENFNAKQFKIQKEKIDLAGLRLGIIKHIRFHKTSDLNKGLVSFLDTANYLGIPYIFSLSAVQGTFQIIFGLWEQTVTNETYLHNCFDTIINSALGFFPGCEVERLYGESKISDSNEFTDDNELPISKIEWWNFILSLAYRRAIVGVPAVKNYSNENKQDDYKQEQTIFGLERLTDSTVEKFALLIYAEPIDNKVKLGLANKISDLHDKIHELTKITSQQSSARQFTSSHSDGTTSSHQNGTSTGQSQSSQSTVKLNIAKNIMGNLKTAMRGGENPTKQATKQTTTQITSSDTNGVSTTDTETIGKTFNLAKTIEITNKKALHLEELTNQLYKRVSIGNGLWRCFIEVYGENEPSVDKISHIFCGMHSGAESRLDPMRSIPLPATANHLTYKQIETTPYHLFGGEFSRLSTLLTSSELANITNLPLHEIPGVPVEKITEYGRNWPTVCSVEDKTISLGVMLDREIITDRHISIDVNKFQRHCFVSGATGSGKSNTMRHLVSQLWNKCKIPFLVIEPVKREYRELKNSLGDSFKVFTLGAQNCDITLNPFDFDQNIGLMSHIDLLKAAFNASLGMYSSMPYILEHMIYQAYELNGWDLATGKNLQLEQAARQLGENPNGHLRTLYLPVLSDLPKLVDEAIVNFFPSSTDYSGSLTGALKSRLTSLTKGTKGYLLNNQQSISFNELLENPCVFELWPFADNDEKSFIMALILMHLYEYRQADEILHGAIGSQHLKHLFVIEEAHRLLAKPVATNEHSSQGKAKGVEVFADILAEIRSYGQGIVVVDQIPSKLIPDVMRNTDLKIAHRLVDKEDRQILGATMNLDEDQIKDLARYSPGQACVYFSGLRKPLHVKISESPLPTHEEPMNIEKTKGDISVWRRASVFGEIPEESFKTNQNAGTFFRCVNSMLIYSLIVSPDAFISSFNNAISLLKKYTECESINLIRIGVMASIVNFMDSFAEYKMPKQSSIEMIIDIATLFKAWFAHIDPKQILLKFKKADMQSVILLLPDKPNATTLLDLFIDIHLNDKKLRDHFQSNIRKCLNLMIKTGNSIELQNIFIEHASSLVLNLPLSSNSINELVLRLIFHYHPNDDNEKFSILIFHKLFLNQISRI
ncbi:MAG: ATP-binding protein [Bacteroidales bacterium]|jgi:hypothetical protein|nr:ATP-binding protein [Bacteroidales bacterium]